MGKTMGIGAASKLRQHRIWKRQLSMGAVCKFRQHRIKKLNSSIIKKRECEFHYHNAWRSHPAIHFDAKQLKKRRKTAANVNLRKKTAENDKVLISRMREIRGARFKAVKIHGVWIRAFFKEKKEKPSS